MLIPPLTAKTWHLAATFASSDTHTHTRMLVLRIWATVCALIPTSSCGIWLQTFARCCYCSSPINQIFNLARRHIVDGDNEKRHISVELPVEERPLFLCVLLLLLVGFFFFPFLFLECLLSTHTHSTPTSFPPYTPLAFTQSSYKDKWIQNWSKIEAVVHISSVGIIQTVCVCVCVCWVTTLTLEPLCWNINC